MASGRTLTNSAVESSRPDLRANNAMGIAKMMSMVIVVFFIERK